jgi:hypothetical protein
MAEDIYQLRVKLGAGTTFQFGYRLLSVKLGAIGAG